MRQILKTFVYALILISFASSPSSTAGISFPGSLSFGAGSIVIEGCLRGGLSLPEGATITVMAVAEWDGVEGEEEAVASTGELPVDNCVLLSVTDGNENNDLEIPGDFTGVDEIDVTLTALLNNEGVGSKEFTCVPDGSEGFTCHPGD